ncbi:hypothetical protein GDO78_019854 [Eleutherodactylus coqui]|uniref:MADF domain-containing protein n=1 Tax=Eleutherodactylus coqui TaxID=57060 RepID=A0A8J6BGD8_ELECQ|nr:hypothetical protein GDO78_019854 [Eleutherodactylus coqui]
MCKQDENLIDIKPEANADNDEMNVSGDHLCKEEEIPVNIGPNRSSERNPPERCPSRLYSQDCPEEGLNVPQDHQVCIKVEIEEEEELPLTTDEIETAHDITTISLVFDMGRLITLMQNFPAIWDVNCSDYLKRSMRDKAWEGLASQIYGKQWRSVSIDMKKYLLDEIKRKWRSARDQFRKEYTATPKSGARGKRKRPYMYLQQLMYLATTMEPRSSADHLENVEEEGEDSVLASSPTEELQSETGENCEVISQGPASQTVPAVPRPRKLGRPTASARRQTEIQQQVLALLQQQTLPRDSAESFGQHVAMLLRTVPENLQLATQNYMLYLLELSLPPNSPYELHYTIDQYRCRQSRQQLATVPPPQPPSPPTPPR